jgi:hypothetical protein
MRPASPTRWKSYFWRTIVLVSVALISGCASDPTSEPRQDSPSVAAVAASSIEKSVPEADTLNFALKDIKMLVFDVQLSAAEASSSPAGQRGNGIQTLIEQRDDLAFAIDALADKTFPDPTQRIKLLNLLTGLLQSVDQLIAGLEWDDDSVVLVKMNQIMHLRTQQAFTAIEDTGGHL